MRYSHNRSFSFSCFCCCLIFLLAACGSTIGPGPSSSTRSTSGNTGGTSNQVPGVHGTPGGAHTTTVTVHMPPTQTSCPASGMARAAAMAPLALGNHPNIVYLVNEGTDTVPTFGTLKRYDVTTGNKTEIVKQNHTRVAEAQVSADGQWLLFIAIISGQPKLQMVRMDGQGLQTLYCGTLASSSASASVTIGDVQWSTDQRQVVFDRFSNGGTAVELLTLATGNLETLIDARSSFLYHTLTWLDNTHIFLSFGFPDNFADTLYLLDTNRGAHQPQSNLTRVFHSTATYPCWSSDSSYDGSRVFISQCAQPPSSVHIGPDAQEGPGSITIQATLSGSPQTLYTDTAHAITTLRAISSRTLLFVINNVRFSTGGGIDISKNGLWKINLDGTGLARLTTNTNTSPTLLNQYTQYPWSNVSRDGSMYVVSQNNALTFGRLSGGFTNTFASISGMLLAIVGWTTM